jgi:hypothetical protein
VLSGGYEDDDDSGVEFWYTGEGGQSSGNKQVGSTCSGYHKGWKSNNVK